MILDRVEGTGFDEDRLVDSLKEELGSPSLFKRLRAWLSHHQSVEIHKAYWCYDKVAERLGLSHRPTFEADYLTSWTEYYLYAAATKPAKANAAFSHPRTVWLTWHHSEAPQLMALIGSEGALTLIAQRARWMVQLLGEENTLLFRQPRAGIPLIRAFQSGRCIAAMIDYCYDETAAVEVSFLGYPARTPLGLFQLAKRFGYTIAIAGIKNGEPQVIARTSASEHTPIELAAWSNRVLERQVIADPPRWMLWPSIHRRWPSVEPD